MKAMERTLFGAAVALVFGLGLAGCPKGACCENGQCAEVREEECAGDYHGDDSSCAEILCEPTGACCEDGMCRETTPSDCLGDFAGAGTTCAETDCGKGACCTGDSCTDAPESQCAGEYGGDGSTCGPCVEGASGEKACQHGPCVKGACCINGQCEQRTKRGCSNGYGVFHGDNVPCAQVNCGAGVCCLAGQQCMHAANAQACAQMGGTFIGGGLDCNGVNHCARGACCLTNGQCVLTGANGCTAPRQYQGDGTVCGPTTCGP